ncbi:MAG: hypothetical protein ACTH5W_11535 [Providencia sp.]|uniref:hypothetical protein n=1 Tax=Providencia sp. TaxID=589 RepID=UPI003F96A63A
MNVNINIENQSVMSDLIRVGAVVQQLEQQGVTVLSVVARQGKPCIHVARHSYCDALIQEGKASYQYFNSHKGKQGVFDTEGCRVYWSESIH